MISTNQYGGFDDKQKVADVNHDGLINAIDSFFHIMLIKGKMIEGVLWINI